MRTFFNTQRQRLKETIKKYAMAFIILDVLLEITSFIVSTYFGKSFF